MFERENWHEQNNIGEAYEDNAKERGMSNIRTEIINMEMILIMTHIAI